MSPARLTTPASIAHRQAADWWLAQHQDLEALIDELTEASSNANNNYRKELEAAEALEDAQWLSKQHGMQVTARKEAG